MHSSIVRRGADGGLKTATGSALFSMTTSAPERTLAISAVNLSAASASGMWIVAMLR